MPQGKSSKCGTATVLAIVAIVIAIFGIGMSGYVLYKQRNSVQDKLNKVDSTAENMSVLKNDLSYLTSKSNNESEVTNHTTELLRNATKELKHDYMNLLSETKALNKTINYTTSATVQKAVEELNSVKETQRVILKKLDALSHVNDTAQDYLNLRQEVRNLTTEVNQNITRLEKRFEANQQDLNDIAEKQEKANKLTSALKANVSSLNVRLDLLSHTYAGGAGILRMGKAICFVILLATWYTA